ncbi:acyl-CoA thioesterase [Nocardioides pacificus]
MTSSPFTAAATPAATPTSAVPGVTEILRLQPLGPLRFRGRTQPPPARRTYGGEVAGQAVAAAGRTVPEDRHIHSMHMHFLRPGDTTVPIDFEVTEVRDGGSFTARRVEAVQKDKVIFTGTASYQRSEDGLSHQVPVVHAPDPDEVAPPEEMFADDPDNLQWVHWLSEGSQVEIRFPELPARAAAAQGHPQPPTQRAWLRLRRPVEGGRREQDAALAFVSDLLLLSSALGPHELTLQGGQLQFATVDHTVWFHHPVRLDEWFLYQQESRWAGGARALAHGEVFDREGRLCATTMQEGLLRLRG